MKTITRECRALAVNYLRSHGETDLLGKTIRYADGVDGNFTIEECVVSEDDIRHADRILEHGTASNVLPAAARRTASLVKKVEV